MPREGSPGPFGEGACSGFGAVRVGGNPSNGLPPSAVSCGENRAPHHHSRPQSPQSRHAERDPARSGTRARKAPGRTAEGAFRVGGRRRTPGRSTPSGGHPRLWAACGAPRGREALAEPRLEVHELAVRGEEDTPAALSLPVGSGWAQAPVRPGRASNAGSRLRDPASGGNASHAGGADRGGRRREAPHPHPRSSSDRKLSKPWACPAREAHT